MMRRVLSIFSSKKYVGRIAGIAIGIGVFALVVRGLNYVYAQDGEIWNRIMWHSFYEQETIDKVYVGTSHVYCDINPFVLDELNGTNNFNLSTPGQKLQQSYYNLLETCRAYNVQDVYLEMYYMFSTGIGGDYSDIDSVKRSWHSTDYMDNTNFIRYQAIFNMSGGEHLLDAFMPFVRYRAYLFDTDYMNKRIAGKQESDYLNYVYYIENEGIYTNYDDKGYYRTNQQYNHYQIYTQDRIAEEMVLTADAQKYLRKILEYCQKHEITITLFTSPIYETQVISTENYDSYVDSVRSIAEEYGVNYYDFNLCKEEYLPIQQAEYFMDVGHLNEAGAELYTNFFYTVVTNAPSDNEQYFYDTYAEKLANESPRLYGVYQINTADAAEKRAESASQTTHTWRDTLKAALLEQDEETTESIENERVYVLAATTQEDMEFRVILTRDDEEGVEYDTPTQQWLQDFDTNRYFTIPTDEHGTFTVVWRLASNPDDVTTMEFAY